MIDRPQNTPVNMQPIQPGLHLEVLSADDTSQIQSATLHVLEQVGVQFPSERELWIPELTHPRPPLGGEPLSGIRQRAREELDRVLAEHQPEPLEEAVQAELQAILEAAERELEA